LALFTQPHDKAAKSVGGRIGGGRLFLGAGRKLKHACMLVLWWFDVRWHARCLHRLGDAFPLFPKPANKEQAAANRRVCFVVMEERETRQTLRLDSKAVFTGAKIELTERVDFQPDSAELTAESQRILDDVAEVMQNHREIKKVRD
jgi:hypothetical protein